LRILALIVATILLLWVMVTAAARVAVNDAIKAPWPAGMGVIRDVPKRYPVRRTTEEAKMLVRLAVAVDVQLGGRGEEVKTELMSDELQEQLIKYLLAQFQKPDDAVDEPPQQLAAFLAERRAAIAALTRFINEAASQLDWSEDVAAESPPSPNLNGYANLTRLLAADALLKGRDGDATAWDRIRAIENLAKPMWRRGDTWSVSSALSASRLANGAARKLPPPLPPWWREVDEFDARRAVIAGQQAKSWMWWNWVEKRWKTNRVLTVIFSPYMDASMANFLNSGRSSAEELAKLRNCGVDADAFARRSRPASWSALRSFGPGSNGFDEQRARVYDFERDAAARVFAIKEHRPLPAASRCADGTWSHASGVLQFSAPIPLKPPGKPAVPRTLRY
jgi:hypothetical protein